MSKKTWFLTALLLFILGIHSARAEWNPPSTLSRQEIVKTSQTLLAMPDLKLKTWEDLFRIRVLEMDWDIGAMVYEPEDSSKIPLGPDGNKIGVFLLHGGTGDHRSLDGVARLLAGKFGIRVVSMAYPGRLYLLDPSRDWPGEPDNSDGTLRMPIWNKDKPITPDQYERVEDRSMMERYGTQILACAKEGTEFYHRMAAYPMAFEEAAKDLMRRHLPEGEFSIYIHGHSTGGPYAYLLTQRVSNIAGVLGMEDSPFGYIYSRLIGWTWNLPFSCLREFTWRLTALFMGGEALTQEGPEALMQLPRLMEQVFESYKRGNTSPQFKAEYPVHLNGVEALGEAAKATAKRLNLSARETQSLVRKFQSYTRELRGEDVKPVPPVLLAIAKNSTDNSVEGYNKSVLPLFAAMKPAPKVSLVAFGGGYHVYYRPESDLPMGVAPAVVKLWYDAITGGYYDSQSRR